MRDIDEVLDRLAATMQAVLDVPPRARWGDHKQAAMAANDAWNEYVAVMIELEPGERPLVDPLWPDRMAAAVELDAKRRAFFAQQTENIRAAWAAREQA